MYNQATYVVGPPCKSCAQGTWLCVIVRMSIDGDIGAGCSHSDDAPSEPGGLWNNRTFDICRQNAVGKEAQFDKRLEKLAQVRRRAINAKIQQATPVSPQQAGNKLATSPSTGKLRGSK